MADNNEQPNESQPGFEHGKNPSPEGRNDGWSDTYAGREGIPPGSKDRTSELYTPAPQGGKREKSGAV